MDRKRFPLVAQEGVPLLLLMVAAAVSMIVYAEPWYALVPLAALVVLFLLFRDPHRAIPPVALGVVSPADGVIEAVDEVHRCAVQGAAWRVRIRVNWLGAYTVRSPVEGQVMDLNTRPDGVGQECPANALWLRTDEGANVVLQFHGYRLGIPPRAFARFGERLGQGQRCAYLRLARFAEVYLPINGKVNVKVGQSVTAGVDLIGHVPHS